MEPTPPSAGPDSAPASSPSTFPRQAATFSLWAPIFSVLLSAFVQPAVRGNKPAMIVVGLISLLLILMGFALGITALLAMRKHGFAGILGKALAGTCINGLLLLAMLLSIPRLMKDYHTPPARQQEQAQKP